MPAKSMLPFDAAAARRLAVSYGGPDARTRRGLALDLLQPVRGEVIVEVGSGPGFVLADLRARVRGELAAVVGVDRSLEMLAAAQVRLRDVSGVRLVAGEATALPLRDGVADGVLTLQVLEYVEDVAAGLAEVRRVLRPGGRLVVWDTDWSTVQWASDDPGRMTAVLQAWDEHCAHPRLPQVLSAKLREAGFEPLASVEHEVVNETAEPGRSSHGLLELIADFLLRREALPAADVAAWQAEQRCRSDEGRYAYRVRQLGVMARVPASAGAS